MGMSLALTIIYRESQRVYLRALKHRHLTTCIILSVAYTNLVHRKSLKTIELALDVKTMILVIWMYRNLR